MTPFSASPAAVALANRCFDDTLPALDRLLYAASLQAYLADAMQSLASVAREEEGHSWADVGAALSITKQAAHQRLHTTAPALDEKGSYMSADQLPAPYLAALRQAAEAVRREGGRDRDLRLLESGIAHLDGRALDAAQHRQYLQDARDALLEAGGREGDVALLDQALAGAPSSADTPVRVDVPYELEVEVEVEVRSGVEGQADEPAGG